MLCCSRHRARGDSCQQLAMPVCPHVTVSPRELLWRAGKGWGWDFWKHVRWVPWVREESCRATRLPLFLLPKPPAPAVPAARTLRRQRCHPGTGGRKMILVPLICTQSPGFVTPKTPPIPARGTGDQGHPGPTGRVSGRAGAAGSDLSSRSSHPPQSPRSHFWQTGKGGGAGTLPREPSHRSAH